MSDHYYAVSWFLTFLMDRGCDRAAVRNAGIAELLDRLGYDRVGGIEIREAHSNEQTMADHVLLTTVVKGAFSWFSAVHELRQAASRVATNWRLDASASGLVGAHSNESNVSNLALVSYQMFRLGTSWLVRRDRVSELAREIKLTCFEERAEDRWTVVVTDDDSVRHRVDVAIDLMLDESLWSFKVYREGEEIGFGFFGEALDADLLREDNGIHGDLDAIASSLGVDRQGLEQLIDDPCPDPAQFARLVGFPIYHFTPADIERPAGKREPSESG